MMKQTHLTLQRYDREMTEYRDHLKKHVQRMMDGVQCVTAPNCGKSCGLFCGVVGTDGPPTAEYQDVYTGTNRKYTGTCEPRLGPRLRARA